jgi:hypothetical protein
MSLEFGSGFIGYVIKNQRGTYNVRVAGAAIYNLVAAISKFFNVQRAL